MKRRQFIKLAGASATGAIATSCGGEDRSAGKKVLVVAFDGMDPAIVKDLMSRGKMPNFSRLEEMGSFSRLGTTTPPHTPVAFASIITGADPGVHQIFDFIHRDPNPPGSALPLSPHFSTSEAVPPEHAWVIPLGNWQVPLTGGSTKLLRRGTAFWDPLIARGIDTEIYYLPSNYPPPNPSGPGRFRCISGMGTPDVLGSYGEFTLMTPDAPSGGRKVGGGRFVRLSMRENHGQAELEGPPNFLRKPDDRGPVEKLRVLVEAVRDPRNPVARIRLSGRSVLLNEGEWSEWIPIEMPTGIPGSSVLSAAGAPTSLPGMVRLFMKSVHPKFELYISPINIDPLAPVNPLGQPGYLSERLARRHGRFYTAGIPEDTKALSHGALNEDQFLQQSDLATEERVLQYRHALADFKSGCLFFYFGATDLVQHMFWRDRDPQHPGRIETEAEKYGGVIEELYAGMDELVGDALDAKGPDDTVLVLSDHGFTSFRRGFNLNSWLQKNGFLRTTNPVLAADTEMFLFNDWAGTKAYGLGMNGLYLNEIGREKFGTVKASERRSLLEEIRDKLVEARDDDGSPVIDRVDLVEEIYPGADLSIAPDLIVGYARGYRASWDTVLGKMPQELLMDNLDRWSGTHLIAAEHVPGMLFASRKVAVPDPNVTDIAPSILDLFSIEKPSTMTGRPLFG